MSDVATPHSTAGMGQKFLSNRNMVLTAATLAVLVLMCGVFATLTDRFLTVSNFQNVMRNAAPVIIASCGMTTVMIARGLDLSVGSVLAASSVIAGSLAVAGVLRRPGAGSHFADTEALEVGAALPLGRG